MAHCADDSQTSEQRAATQAVPEDHPGLSAPERKARSQKPDVYPCKLRVIRFHCVLVMLRPQAVCVDRATGLVALSPFHAPGVPFAAAGIPPHCSVAAARPCVFTPGQSAQRCARSAPRLMSPLRRRPPGAGRVPFLCCAQHKKGYVAGDVMLRDGPAYGD